MPRRNASASDLKSPRGASGKTMGAALSGGGRVGSSASAGRAPVITRAKTRALNVRIALLFAKGAGVGDSAVPGAANALCILPDGARAVVGLARLPGGAPFLELVVGQAHRKRALDGVDLDDVAVLDERDGAADGRLRPDMADAEAARGAGEAPIGDQRNLAAHALACEGG